jgi:hypothetical protein
VYEYKSRRLTKLPKANRVLLNTYVEVHPFGLLVYSLGFGIRFGCFLGILSKYKSRLLRRMLRNTLYWNIFTYAKNVLLAISTSVQFTMKEIPTPTALPNIIARQNVIRVNAIAI